MKTILLAAGLLSAVFSAHAQMQPPPPTLAELAAGAEATAPFKGANVILIYTADSSAVALKKMARALIVANIEPDKVDTEVGYLTTKGKAEGQLTPAVFAYRVISSPAATGGTVLRVSGTYTVQLSLLSAMTNPMGWAPSNLTQAKACFVAVEPAARAYPGGRVRYVREAAH